MLEGCLGGCAGGVMLWVAMVLWMLWLLEDAVDVRSAISVIRSYKEL